MMRSKGSTLPISDEKQYVDYDKLNKAKMAAFKVKHQGPWPKHKIDEL